jgi:hypothetical protein
MIYNQLRASNAHEDVLQAKTRELFAAFFFWLHFFGRITMSSSNTKKGVKVRGSEALE